MTLKANVEWLKDPDNKYQQIMVMYGKQKDVDEFIEKLRLIGFEYFLFEYKDNKQFDYAFTSSLCDFFIVLEEGTNK